MSHETGLVERGTWMLCFIFSRTRLVKWHDFTGGEHLHTVELRLAVLSALNTFVLQGRYKDGYLLHSTLYSVSCKLVNGLHHARKSLLHFAVSSCSFSFRGTLSSIACPNVPVHSAGCRFFACLFVASTYSDTRVSLSSLSFA